MEEVFEVFMGKEGEDTQASEVKCSGTLEPAR